MRESCDADRRGYHRRLTRTATAPRDAVSNPFVRADRHCAEDRQHPGPDERTLAERVTAHGDPVNGVARETLLTGIGLDRHVIAREARQCHSNLLPIERQQARVPCRSPRPRCRIDA